MKKRIKIILEPQSFLLCSSNATSGTFDAQFIMDECGRPYFPGRTFKGLLRESMLEVLEILGKDNVSSILDDFFGVEGNMTNYGLLRIGNLYPPQNLKLHDVFHRINKTALDNETEIAKNESLRSFAVLDYHKVPSFSTELEIDLNSDYEGYFNKAIHNLRRAGQGRNTGEGKIKVRREKTEMNPAPLANNTLPKGIDCLDVTLKAHEPLILTSIDANRNTVFSKDFISGSQLWGAMAWQFGNFNGPQFSELFLQGKLTFSNLFVNGSQKSPLNLQKRKHESSSVFENIFELNGDSQIRKPSNGYVCITNGILEIPKMLNFHHQRSSNRTLGKSTEEEGAIFYYESINKGTIFKGQIHGPTDLLEKIYRKFSRQTLFIGRSKSAQYGKVEVEIKPEKSAGDTIKGDCYLYCKSPLILMNEHGYVSLSKDDLAKELGINHDNISDATARHDTYETYSSVWKSKTGRYDCISEGSVFKVNLKQEQKKHQFIGEFTDKGLGEIIFYNSGEMKQIGAMLAEIRSDEVAGQDRDSEVDKTKNEALKLALKVGDSKNEISGNLISRMIGILNSHESVDDIIDQIKSLKDKPAGKKLNALKLYDDLTHEGEFKGKQYKIYWTTFFTALRKIAKWEMKK